MAEIEGTHNNSNIKIEQLNQKRLKLNKRRKESKIKSWICKFFELSFKEGVRYAVCKVEEVVRKECKKTYKIGTLTSNCSDHFVNIYGITQEYEKVNIICDSQPLTVLESLAFKQLIFQLDLKFQMFNPKYIKLLIHKAYNYSKSLIMEKLEKDTNAVSLTSDHISDTLLTVLDEWELQNKTFIITINNEKWLDDSALQESLMRTKTALQEGWNEPKANWRIEIYTDGSLTKTRDHLDQEFKIVANIRYWPSSTRTEICAILIALMAVLKLAQVVIYTDSQCTIDDITTWNKKSA
ncbi:hypothetical protein GLOIN_2v1489122 [Rhizophagus clarus]|uniref:RNase H type-1 domain-containing protein n=1 Tax=Rhizophagus clarus TaxID=94130 RepID=A0A8H3QTA4_9GLOM|nr:hypothetical protein GLOIN_2v1489122 [Rhizophagus clarus]